MGRFIKKELFQNMLLEEEEDFVVLNSVLTTDAGHGQCHSAAIYGMYVSVHRAGVFCAIIYMYRNRYNKSFVVTLALMPLIVQLVIMLVSGNLGAGVAVMGAFSLVRFRSIPGTAKDIGSIFCAMAVGWPQVWDTLRRPWYSWFASLSST